MSKLTNAINMVLAAILLAGLKGVPQVIAFIIAMTCLYGVIYNDK